jgi:tryptophanyl-tRNA synthetase
MSKKILLSGIKPTGRPHIGNYFGAMKQYVDLQENYENYIFVANYHAMTTVHNKEELARETLDIVLDYLAIGLDPEKTTLYLQSDVPEVTELTWIFNTLVTVPYLQRSHAYKDSIAKGYDPNVGLFNYPVLMASDILIQNADVVPVGLDQKQHIEYARDIAEKFNNTFGKIFKLPEHLILKDVAIVPGIDGKKMSKNYGNTIPLFATREKIQKAVMSIVTDSSGDFPHNVFSIHKLFKNENELSSLYESNKGNYKTLKEALIEDMDAYIKPLRERRDSIAQDEKYIRKALQNGGKKARSRAQEKMYEVKQKVGIL